MKIMYAVHHLPPRYTGGAENRVLRTARWMHQHSHSVALVAVESVDLGEPSQSDALQDGMLVRRLSFDHHLFPDAHWTYDNPVVGQRLDEFIAEQRPDVFHLVSGYLMTTSAIRAARAAGVPVVITLTDFWFLCPRITLLHADGSLCPRPPADPLDCARCLAEDHRRFRWPAHAAPRMANLFWHTLGPAIPAGRAGTAYIAERRQMLREALSQAAALICPSRFLREMFIEAGVAPGRLLAMRQGLQLSQVASFPRAEPGPDRPFVIGYSGQIKPHKGVDILIDAARRLVAEGLRFTVALYGDASDDPAYTEVLRRHAGKASWLEWRGRYAPTQVWQSLAQVDAVVVPSRWYENSPNIILEAQASRVPVVATDLGGMAELVHHEIDGLLFRLNDAQDLAHQLRRLIQEPGLAARLQASAPAVKSLDDEMRELSVVYQHVSGGA